MIPEDILFQLVPDREPEESFPGRALEFEVDPNIAARRIAMWSAYLRHRLSRQLIEDTALLGLIETSGFIGTGIFRVPLVATEESYAGFPSIRGFQVGVVLLRAGFVGETRTPYIGGLSLESGRYRAPLVEVIASFNPHAPANPDGYVAALYSDIDGDECGITAAHVLSSYRRGQRVPISCSDCGASARLKRKAPGLIDAAAVVFPCGGPPPGYQKFGTVVRSAIEGEPVRANYGDTGPMLCTVMMSLSSPTEIKCAAIPKHFLTDAHGHPGDSGSLISGIRNPQVDADLIGMYLGDADCEDRHQSYTTYGFCLDLKQAAGLLGANDLRGEYNV